MSILREGPVDPPTEKPDLSVWMGIASELGDEVAVGETAEEAAAAEASDGKVVSLAQRRSRGRNMAIITAFAAALLLVAIPLALASRGGSPDQLAELAALEGFAGAGEAELDGRTLTVDLEGLEALTDGATYDLWLLDDSGDPRWIGFATAEGSFDIPEDVDLDRYNVVDVSIEPDDGDETHSGNSVLRGGLTLA